MTTSSPGSSALVWRSRVSCSCGLPHAEWPGCPLGSSTSNREASAMRTAALPLGDASRRRLSMLRGLWDGLERVFDRVPRRLVRLVVVAGAAALAGAGAVRSGFSVAPLGRVAHPQIGWLGIAVLAEAASLGT